ncbi:MAG TPA: hypothetical protein VH186_29765 [Chloroflexia bacterium]|nr:hypothetical protein [Chloroflexia bacterium]
MKPLPSGGPRPLALVAALSCLLLTLVISTLPVSAAPNFGSTDFENVWNRTDKQVAAGQVSRTWLWGPAPFNAGLTEDYAESPGGKRQVQYFDKSRMEINNPNGDRSNPYYVTNGLIVREMMDGRLQLGDNKFESRPPAEIGVAGDADDTLGPTYKALGKLTAKAEDLSGILVAGSVDRIGNTRFDVGDYGKKYQVSYAHYEPLTGHNIAGVFWSFLNQTDKVLNSQGQVVNGRIFDPVYYATGLPVTEAYWAQVKVGGQVKDVLVQAFERRIMTFTPSNTPAFQVEMGNVGQHYYNWRYNTPVTTPTPTTAPAVTPAKPAPAKCEDLPASSTNIFTVINCGPAGMQLIVGGHTVPHENLVLTPIDPNGTLLKERALGIVTDAQGNFLERINTLPQFATGMWTIKMHGDSSGIEGNLYIWLDPPVTKPTIIARPDTAKKDEVVGLLAVGFNPNAEFKGTYKFPSGATWNFFGDSLVMSDGGSFLIPFKDTNFSNARYQQSGKITVIIIELPDEKVYASTDFTVVD